MNSAFASGQIGAMGLCAGLLLFAAPSPAADLSLPVSGNLLGSIVDATGIPQRGASVQLFNKYEQLVAKTASDSHGRFAFVSLPADLYSLHATLASFLPASKDRIAVQAGSSSVLQIHLATLFSNVELSYVVPNSAMADDWKWVLRSSPATRPITRLVDDSEEDDTSAPKPRVFTQTHAMLSLSGGDGGSTDTDAFLGDWGTGFSLTTTVLGKNQLQVSGSFGDKVAIGTPAVTICAIYSSNEDSLFGRPPEITLMMSQIGGMTSQLYAGQNASPASTVTGYTPLRAMSLGMYQVADPADNIHLEYGMSAESIDYLQHNSRISPFARLSVDTGKTGQWIASYSDGSQPEALARHGKEFENQLDQDMDGFSAASSLGRVPQISRRGGRLEMQRTRSFELGVNKVSGSRTYSISGFSEDVAHGRINLAGDLSSIQPDDLLTDGFSTTSSYNVGRYRRSGYLASAVQKIGNDLDLTLAYGRMGGFTANRAPNSSGPGLQNFISETTANLAAAELRAVVPVIGTQLSGGYGWVDGGAMIPRHLFTTQSNHVSPGLNFDFRQPLPSVFGFPGRLEITAGLRNMLAQGYLPVGAGQGHQLLVVQAPRSIRGGLNFIF